MSANDTTRRSLSEPRPGRPDWDRLRDQSDEEIAAQVAADPDAAPLMTDDWIARAVVVTPGKKPINIRIDTDILDWFQQHGRNYQTRINNVLRAYVEAQKNRA